MSCSAMLRRPVRFWQDAEKVRQRRSRKTRPPHRLGGVHKRDARYSARREPQRLTAHRTATGQEPVLTGSGWAGTKERFASSLTAALLDGLFAHPAG